MHAVPTIADHAADTCAIIVAGGSGERFGDPRGKQFVEVCGLPLLCWSLLAFDAAPCVAQIVVVAPAGREDELKSCAIDILPLMKPVVVAPSGETRQDSVRHGLAASDETLPFVAIHDGARPLILPSSIDATVRALRDDDTLDGTVAACPAIDTLKIVNGDIIESTPDRSRFWMVQTPQVFRSSSVASAHSRAVEEGFIGTDDASLVERIGGRVRCVAVARDNIKVTVPEDLTPVRAILEQRIADAACAGGAES